MCVGKPHILVVVVHMSTCSTGQDRGNSYKRERRTYCFSGHKAKVQKI